MSGKSKMASTLSRLSSGKDWFSPSPPLQHNPKKTRLCPMGPTPIAHRYEPWVIATRASPPWYDVRFRGYGQNKIVHLEALNASGHSFVVEPGAWLVHRPHAPTRVKLQHAQDFRDIAAASAGATVGAAKPHAGTVGGGGAAGVGSGSGVQVGRAEAGPGAGAGIARAKGRRLAASQNQGRVPHQRALAASGGGGGFDALSTVYGHTKALGDRVRKGLQQGTYHPVLDPATQACMRKLPWWAGVSDL